MTNIISRIGRYGVDGYLVIVGLAIVLIFVSMALFAELISSYNPIDIVGSPVQPPSDKYIFGTDSLGRDVLSRLIYGARTIMGVIAVSAAVSMLIGVPLGLISGYFGGYIDRILSVIMDSIYAFPGLILAIAVASVLGPGIYNAAFAISVVYIPTYFRMVRGHVLGLKETLFVEAAKSLGATNTRIMFRHILGNTLYIVTVIFSLNVSDAVLTEAGLSFLGLSVSSPTPDWGFDLRNGQRYFLSGYWWPVAIPGFAIILLALGFGLLGEGLNTIVGGGNTRGRQP